MNNTRKTLLVTAAAAALLAGAGLASAQGTNENHGAPGAAANDQKAPRGKMDHQPGSVSQKSPTPTAQAPTKEKPAPTALVPMKEKRPAPTVQAPTKEKLAPTAHAPMKENPGAAQAPGVSQPKTAGQEGVVQTSKSPNLRTAPTVARDETKSGAPAALSAEQHASRARHPPPPPGAFEIGYTAHDGARAPGTACRGGRGAVRGRAAGASHPHPQGAAAPARALVVGYRWPPHRL